MPRTAEPPPMTNRSGSVRGERTSTHDELGRMAGFPREQVVQAALMIRTGTVVSLAGVRFPGMPLFPGHPPFQVLNYRTPRGIRSTGAQPWGPVNDAGMGYMAEYIMATSHSGAHVDALAHMTVGPDMHWYGGGNSDEHLSDFGPLVGDAPAWSCRRGCFITARRWLGRGHA